MDPIAIGLILLALLKSATTGAAPGAAGYVSNDSSKLTHRSVLGTTFTLSETYERSHVAADGLPLNPMTDPGVALPGPISRMRSRYIYLQSTVTGKTALVPVRDVGPWYVNDIEYVFGDARPLAEVVRDTYRAMVSQFPERKIGIYIYIPRGYPWPATIASRMALQTTMIGDTGYTFAQRIPLQKAAIDITPAAWRLIGHDGNVNGSYYVNWGWA